MSILEIREIDEMQSVNNMEKTQSYKVVSAPDPSAREILEQVHAALKEKGYDPINQVVGYIMSGDPTYVTAYRGARALITKVDREELVEELLEAYINYKE